MSRREEKTEKNKYKEKDFRHYLVRYMSIED